MLDGCNGAADDLCKGRNTSNITRKIDLPVCSAALHMLIMRLYLPLLELSIIKHTVPIDEKQVCASDP